MALRKHIKSILKCFFSGLDAGFIECSLLCKEKGIKNWTYNIKETVQMYLAITRYIDKRFGFFFLILMVIQFWIKILLESD